MGFRKTQKLLKIKYFLADQYDKFREVFLNGTIDMLKDAFKSIKSFSIINFIKSFNRPSVFYQYSWIFLLVSVSVSLITNKHKGLIIVALITTGILYIYKEVSGGRFIKKMKEDLKEKIKPK